MQRQEDLRSKNPSPRRFRSSCKSSCTAGGGKGKWVAERAVLWRAMLWSRAMLVAGTQMLAEWRRWYRWPARSSRKIATHTQAGRHHSPAGA